MGLTEDISGRMTDKVKAALVLAAAVAFVLSPFLSGSFGGFEPGQFPVPQDDPPAQPAGYAFAIWTLIYGWLLVSAGFGLWQRADHTDWDRVRWPLIVALAAGALWIPIALRSPLLATLVIWVMLIAAVRAFLVTPERDYWLLRVPLGLFAGWLTAASWVSVALVAAGWGLALGPVAWAWIAMAGALVFAFAVLWQIGRAPEYGGPIAWALVAIAVSNVTGHLLLALGALIGAAVVAAMSWFIRARR